MKTNIYKTMERASNKSLDLVLDMTLCSSSNEMPSQYIHQILQLLPFDASDNIASILVYNPNSYLRKYVKKLSRPLSHKMTKRTFFAVTLAELYEFINPSEVRLPKSTSKCKSNPNLHCLNAYFSITGY
jgi:hypothetical protein